MKASTLLTRVVSCQTAVAVFSVLVKFDSLRFCNVIKSCVRTGIQIQTCQSRLVSNMDAV